MRWNPNGSVTLRLYKSALQNVECAQVALDNSSLPATANVNYQPLTGLHRHHVFLSGCDMCYFKTMFGLYFAANSCSAACLPIYFLLLLCYIGHECFSALTDSFILPTKDNQKQAVSIVRIPETNLGSRSGIAFSVNLFNKHFMFYFLHFTAVR